MGSEHPRELILINPRVACLPFDLIQRVIVGHSVPYALMTLAALTPGNYRVRIINQRIIWPREEFVKGRLVGITCVTASVANAYSLADKFRRAGSRVVLGGPHVTALPQEALEHADSVVTGEAESVWGGLLKDFENGCLRKIYAGEPLEDFFSPVYDYFFRLEPSVLRDIGIHVDRGCKYDCDFCARLSHVLRFIETGRIIGLIRRIREEGWFPPGFKPSFAFRCDNIFSSPAHAKKLFKEMLPLRVSWRSSCSIDMGFDQEALRLARESGCCEVLIGFETTHPQDYQKTSLKQIHSLRDYKIAIKNFSRHGIRVVGAFIIGLDSSGHRDYLRLLWFILTSGLWHSVLAILTPYPGSAVHDRLKQEGRILSFDWRRYNSFQCVFKPRHMSKTALYFWLFGIRFLTAFFSPCVLLALGASTIIGWFLGSYLAPYLFFSSY